jgi:hypothetical protein
VKLPVADMGVNAFATGTRSIGERSSRSKGFRVFVVCVSWMAVLLFMVLSLLGLNLVVR